VLGKRPLPEESTSSAEVPQALDRKRNCKEKAKMLKLQTENGQEPFEECGIREFFERQEKEEAAERERHQKIEEQWIEWKMKGYRAEKTEPEFWR
jgi:hypothetical protein